MDAAPGQGPPYSVRRRLGGPRLGFGRPPLLADGADHSAAASTAISRPCFSH